MEVKQLLNEFSARVSNEITNARITYDTNMLLSSLIQHTISFIDEIKRLNMIHHGHLDVLEKNNAISEVLIRYKKSLDEYFFMELNHPAMVINDITVHTYTLLNICISVVG